MNLIGMIVQGILLLRYWFWRLVLQAYGGALGSGTRIYEGVKIYLTQESPVLIGRNCTLQKGVVLAASDRGKIILRDHVYLGEYVVLSSKAEVEVGEHAIIATHTFVVDFDHGYEDPEKLFYDQEIKSRKVRIGRNVWIGAGCQILKGVTLGEGSVVGAGSVVTRDVPPFTVCAGVPARVLRERVKSQQQALNG